MVEFKKGDKVWVRLSWQDDDCWWGPAVVIKEPAKRVQSPTMYSRDDCINPFYAKNNVKFYDAKEQS